MDPKNQNGNENRQKKLKTEKNVFFGGSGRSNFFGGGERSKKKLGEGAVKNFLTQNFFDQNFFLTYLY